MQISSHTLHQIMNPSQAIIEDEARLEHYIHDVLPAEKRAHASRHIPYSMDVETFDRVESDFIKEFFAGSLTDYNIWKKDNRQYIEGGDDYE